MTYTNIIPEAERMTWEDAFKRADKEGGPQGYLSAYREALAKRIQMTEPKPVDPVQASVEAIGCEWEPEDCAKFRAELAKRGGRIVFDGEEG